ncbi:MAG: outer membrane beta-barrel protein [Bacteroidia bacterium]|nr:outer membrane beta-barrel protein [Bacteroidia bacterium]
MDIRKIGWCVILVLVAGPMYAQKPSYSGHTEYFRNDDSPIKLNFETASIFYNNTESGTRGKFGFGLGGEFYFHDGGISILSVAPMVSYWGAEEERKTYRVDNGSYYYRSTTLTGKLTLNIALMYKRRIHPNWQVGFGYQPQIMLASFRDQVTHGETNSEIPDIQFSKTGSSVVGMVGYRIDRRYRVNLFGQYGIGAVIQGAKEPRGSAIRLQISRGLFML